MTNARRTVLITGATDGIGLALAKLYRWRGKRIILIGRKKLSVLSDTFFSSSTYCQADLSQPDCVDKIVEFLENQGIGELDVLIHNAAVGYYGLLDEPPEKIIELITVNLWSPIALTHALLPRLQIPNGQVVFISSVVSKLACPNYAVYAATKAAIDGFARSLRIELVGSATVQVIHPGATQTGMFAKMGVSRETMDWDRFPAADAAANQISMAIASRSPNVTLGFGNRLIRSAGYLLPGLVDRFSGNTLKSCKRERQGAGRTRRCVITGAADGIGKALAHRFAMAGYVIVGVDIDAEMAAATQAELEANGALISFLIADLGSREGINHVLSSLAAAPPVDVFIHNAGINAVGRFADSDLARQKLVLNLNLLAPLLITNGLLRNQGLSGSASLVFISSLSKYLSYPAAAVYAATKDALASYAHSVRVALRPDRNALTVFPGPTQTGHARRYSPNNEREDRRMPAECLAGAVFKGVAARRSVVIPGLGNRILAVLGHFSPRLVELGMRKVILAEWDRAQTADDYPV
jgi:short-subunit dehydrogenase